MKNVLFPKLTAVFVVLFFFVMSCKTDTKNVVTNPLFTIAPTEYAGIAEKALIHFGDFEYDAWADMLSDNVEYDFPDGDENTRTKLIGKPAVIVWWKNWQKTSGAESMTMSGFNHFPLEVTGEANGGAAKGMYVFSYFSNKIVYKGKPIGIRMNFITHFNNDKKIDRYITYYDRNILIKTTGKDVLEKKEGNQ